ncbi:hypothetical protein [Mycolicibacterium porcinum]|uniref:hypothetical protein n=1 Tax=Mycolicibacterium porcinum TaxID=39693 RepID=UPI0013F4E542|nr:hypothetical protein [Mycolicibacterium porcinum]
MSAVTVAAALMCQSVVAAAVGKVVLGGEVGRRPIGYLRRGWLQHSAFTDTAVQQLG